MTDKLSPCNPWALERMNVPQRLWGVSYIGLPEILRKPVQKYVSELDAMLDKGRGFFLYGGPGVGKTSAGVVLLKGIWERRKTGYFTTIKELRQAIREDETFDGSQSVVERCRNVDMLVLDDLALEDFKNFTFGIAEVEHLLKNRSMRSKGTVLTTRLLPDIFRSDYPAILATMQGSFLPVLLEGENHKVAADRELRKDLGVS